MRVRRLRMVKLETVDTKCIATGANPVRQQGTLHEQALNFILGTAMLGSHVHPQIIIAVEAVLTGVVETGDVAACFLGVTLAS